MDEKTRKRMRSLAEDAPVENYGLLPVTEPTEQPPKLRGVGDVVAKVTAAVGIKPCVPCKKRQERLNRLLPFKK